MGWSLAPRSGTGGGPTVAGVATDKITTLAADSTFNDISLTARNADGSDITVNAGVAHGNVENPRGPVHLSLIMNWTMTCSGGSGSTGGAAATAGSDASTDASPSTGGAGGSGGNCPNDCADTDPCTVDTCSATGCITR